jgi:hypothetical protein
MDEQLQQILQEADRKGYNPQQKEELVTWYLSQQGKPDTTPSPDDYLAQKYSQRKPKTPGALEQLATSAYSAIADQLPAGFESGRAASKSAQADSDKEFYDELILSGKLGETDWKEVLKNPDAYRTKRVAEYRTKIGEEAFAKEQSDYRTRYKGEAVAHLREAGKEEAEGAERTKGNITQISQIQNVGDAIRYGGSAIGEALGSSIPAALTGGASAYGQEFGGAYKEAVEQTAKALSDQYGEIWTPETVIKLGYDKPAQDYASTVANVNTALEGIGLLSVFGKGATPFAKKAAKEAAKSALKTQLKAVGQGTIGEGVTEFLQESATQYGALKAAGHTDEEIFGTDGSTGLFDWGRSIEAGVRGGIGGGAMGGVSSAVSGTESGTTETVVGDPKIAKQEIKAQEKVQKVEEKLAEKQGERNAILDKADAITNEAVDETINEGTEEDVNEFANSIKDLIEQKERDEEISKVQEDVIKVEEEKTKVADKALKAYDKLVAAETKTEATEQTTTPTEPTKTVTSPVETQIQEPISEKKDTPGTEQAKTETQELPKTRNVRKRKAQEAAKIEGKKQEEKTTIEPPTVDVGVQSELPVEEASAKQEEAIETEKVKLLTQFNNRMKLAKPSQKLQRLTDLRERIDKAKFPKEHSDLITKVDKEISKLSVAKEEKIEKAKKAPVKVEKTPEQINREKEIETTTEELTAKRQAIVDKYGEIRTKTGQVVRRATPQPQWDVKDIDDIREYNKQLEDLAKERKKVSRTPEQEADVEAYKAKGLDDDTANAIVDADEVVDLGIEDLPIENLEREDRLTRTWDNLKEETVDDYVSKTKASVSPEIQDVWAKAIDQMHGVIQAAMNRGGKKLRVFSGSTDKTILGQAIRDGGNFYIFIKDKEVGRTRLHEFVHIFEFAINYLQGGVDEKAVLTKSFQEINKIHNELLTAVSRKLSPMVKKLKAKKSGSFKAEFNNLTNDEKLLALYLTKGDPSRLSLSYLNEVESQIHEIYYGDMGDRQRTIYPIYGLANGREMVAEAMSNPYFMGLLANIKSNTGQNYVPFLERIYNALVAMLDQLSKILADSPLVKQYNIKLPSYKKFKDTYLNRILSTLDEHLSDFDPESGEYDIFGNSLDDTFLEEEAPEKKENRKINKELSDKIFNRAVKQNISDIATFKNFVADIEKQTGKSLGGVKGGLTRRFNTYLKRLEIVNNKSKIIEEARKSEKGDSPDFSFLLDDAEQIDGKSLSLKDREKFAKALEAIQSQDNSLIYKAKGFIQEQAAKRATDAVTDPKTGVGFREFNKVLKAMSADNLVNLPTFISYISKYSTDKAATLMQYFHDPIGSAYKNTSMQVNLIVSELNRLAIKNKLGRSNFSRMYLYGQLISENPIKPSTLDDRYAAEKFALQTTLRAIKKSHETDITEAEAVRDLEILDQVYQGLKSGEFKLDEGEQEYYNEIRDVLDSNLQTIRDNSEIAWGQDFVPITNYLPKVVKGAIPMPVKGDATDEKAPVTKNITMGESDLLDVMGSTPDYQPLRTSESGFHYVRTGGRGVYYDTNIHSNMAKYLQSTLFNVNAAYQVQKLNKMFKGSNAVKLEDELGVRNTEKMLKFLKNSIKYSRRVSADYSAVTEFLLDAKNKLQTAKIGTSGQFLTQLVPMIPATMALTGYGNTQKAMKYMWKMHSDPEMRDRFKNLVADFSSQLAIRDFFFEKYETVEDIAKEGTAGKLRRFADKVERETVVKVMGWSDRTAAQLTFLSAFIEAGADMDDASTWTPERIAKAELKTAQLQNISSPIYAPEALRADNSKSALLNAALWSFKSFSMNGMMNFLLSAPEAVRGNTEARRIALAHATSALGFEASSIAVKGGYALAAYGIAQAFGYEPPERKKEEDALDYIKRILTNGFYSLFFGGMPSYADNAMRYILNSTVLKWIYGEDSPLYSAKKPEELPGKALGPFEEMYTLPLHTMDYMSDYIGQEKITEDETWELFGKIVAEGIMFSRIVPFRGDIAKTIRTGISESKQAKYERRNRRKKLKKQQYY